MDQKGNVEDVLLQWLDDKKNIHVIPFPQLLQELTEYTPSRQDVPLYGTDEYWDWRCCQAKKELHSRIDTLFWIHFSKCAIDELDIWQHCHKKMDDHFLKYSEKGIQGHIKPQFITGIDPIS